MIKVTGINNIEFILNAEHIEKLEEVPECLITLVNGKKYMVRESSKEVVERVIKYKNRIFTLDIKEH